MAAAAAALSLSSDFAITARIDWWHFCVSLQGIHESDTDGKQEGSVKNYRSFYVRKIEMERKRASKNH